MNILDKIVEEKKGEVAKLPARLIAAGDLRDAMLERGERRDFIAALRRVKSGSSRGNEAQTKKSEIVPQNNSPSPRRTRKGPG